MEYLLWTTAPATPGLLKTDKTNYFSDSIIPNYVEMQDIRMFLKWNKSKKSFTWPDMVPWGVVTRSRPSPI